MTPAEQQALYPRGTCSVRCADDRICGAPAGGPQEPGQQRAGRWGAGYVHGYYHTAGVWLPPLAPADACYSHGGPPLPGEPTP